MTTELMPLLDVALGKFNLNLTDRQKHQLLNYLDMLYAWNRVYNISGHTDKLKMFSHHLVDSLAVIKPLHDFCLSLPESNNRKPIRVLDVGSGAGLPGVVIAICFPLYQVVCLDAVAKKMAFVQQALIRLQLNNATAVHSRMEEHRSIYSIIVSRAFSSLQTFVSISDHCLDQDGCWMAMKGKEPMDEIRELDQTYKVFHVEQLIIPDSQNERCLVWIKKQNRLVT